MIYTNHLERSIPVLIRYCKHLLMDMDIYVVCFCRVDMDIYWWIWTFIDGYGQLLRIIIITITFNWPYVAGGHLEIIEVKIHWKHTLLKVHWEIPLDKWIQWKLTGRRRRTRTPRCRTPASGYIIWYYIIIYTYVHIYIYICICILLLLQI